MSLLQLLSRPFNVLTHFAVFSCESFIAYANIVVCFVKSDTLSVALARQIATWRLQSKNKIILNYNKSSEKPTSFPGSLPPVPLFYKVFSKVKVLGRMQAPSALSYLGNKYLKMASAQVVGTSVANNSPSQGSNHLDDFFFIKAGAILYCILLSIHAAK